MDSIIRYNIQGLRPLLLLAQNKRTIFASENLYFIFAIIFTGFNL